MKTDQEKRWALTAKVKRLIGEELMHRDSMFVSVNATQRSLASSVARAGLLALAAMLALACAQAQTSDHSTPVAEQFTIGQDQAQTTSLSYSFKRVDFPGAASTFVYAINNQGQIVGSYTGDGCYQSSCGFTDVKGKFTSIECVLQNATDFFDISNKGEIVGTYSYYGGVHGFIWEGNNSCFTVDPYGSNSSEAWGVNDSGEVVGFYTDSAGNYEGFLYDDGDYKTVECAGVAGTGPTA